MTLAILTFEDDMKSSILDILLHILCTSSKKTYPNTKLAMAHIEKDFIYDFDFETIYEEDLEAVEKEMKNIIKKI